MQAAYLTTTFFPPMGPIVQRDLHLSQLVVTGRLIAYAVFLLGGVVAGLLLARRWPVAVLPAAAVLILIGLVPEAFAPSLGMLLVGTFVTGLGGGLMVGAAFAVAARSCSPMKVMSGLAGAIVLSLVVGWVATLVLATAFSWRLAFLAALPVALLVLAGLVVGEIVVLVRRPAPAARA